MIRGKYESRFEVHNYMATDERGGTQTIGEGKLYQNKCCVIVSYFYGSAPEVDWQFSTPALVSPQSL